MAGRPQHANDGGIAERRLRPIYDWLDNGNNKKALQEAEKVLKKSPSLQAARALKALSLLRLGKATEAHTVLEALAEEHPSDDTTLQAMTISYRECQKFSKVCSLYEAAVKVEPTSEELHSHLFMSYVRIGDYRAQQRAAMAVYKVAPKNPYYFWAVMSIVLQAKTTDDTTKKGILLTLAQRMVDNFIQDNKIEAEQEARLYVMILELQEKWEDILKFMEGPLYNKLVPGDMPQASIPYLRHLGQWKKLNLLCKELLWDNQDRWNYYLPYLDSVFELMKNTSEANDGENSPDDTAEKCHLFICELVESMSARKVLRGPYLARLELWKRLSKVGDAQELLGSPVALCVQYLRVFGNKPCAVPDLRPYLTMIPQKEREEHCEEFLKCFGFDENSKVDNIEDIQRHVNCIGAWRLCAAPLSASDSLALARTLRHHYLTVLQKGLAISTITEFGAADTYALLAAHHYFYAGVLDQSAAPIIEALSLLELVLHKSPANFHVKLLLVKLYHLLGAALAADGAYARLEAKHVQLVALGWLHAARLAPAVAHARALQLLADAAAFHNHHAKESMEQLTYSYKYGTFSKLVELLAWNLRLERCAWSAAGARERTLLSLLAGPTAPRASCLPLVDGLTDNRDLSVIVSWETEAESEAEARRVRTFEQEEAYLRLKDGFVTALTLCIELANRQSNEDKKKYYDELKECTESIVNAIDKCKEKYSVNERLSISTPFQSRIIGFVKSTVPYRELYRHTLLLVGELALRSQLVAPACATLVKLLATPPPFGDRASLWHYRETLENISNYLEYLGVATFILGLCNDLTTSPSSKKNKRKVTQSPADLKTIDLLNELNQTVQDNILFAETLFSKIPQIEINNTLEEEFSKLNMADDFSSPVETKLRNSYSEVSDDVKNVFKKKIKYLKSLMQ